MNDLNQWMDWIVISVIGALALSMGLLSIHQSYKANKAKKHPATKAKFIVNQDRSRLAWDESIRKYRK